MANGNGRTAFEVIRDIVIYLIIPLLGLGYWKIDGSIEKNGEMLRGVQSNQIRVIENLRMVKEDLDTHISTAERQTAERGRLHHVSTRSCLECKERPSGYPQHSHPESIKLPNPFLSK